MNMLSVSLAFVFLGSGAPARAADLPHVPSSTAAVRAEAEVSAVKKPLTITLRVHKTKIKLGESLWYQLVLSNLDDQARLPAGRMFLDPEELSMDMGCKCGTFIEAVDGGGRTLPVAIPLEPPRDAVAASPEDDEYAKTMDEFLARPENRGISQEERARRLSAFLSKSSIPDVVMVEPGSSVQTRSWFHYGYQDKKAGLPKPEPIGDFSELEYVKFPRPGRYRIRAVYDLSPRKGEKKKYAHELRCATPWIDVFISK